MCYRATQGDYRPVPASLREARAQGRRSYPHSAVRVLSSAFLVAAIASIESMPNTCLAASWSMGSHFGMSVIHSSVEGSGSSTVVGVPASAISYQPGLRVAVGNSGRSRELGLDLGLFVLDEGGARLSLFNASFNYLHCFRPLRKFGVLASTGAGVVREGGGARSSYSASFGGGVGLRRVVRDNHGAVRIEARIDCHGRDGVRGRPFLTTAGLRLGFDLWL